MSDRLEPFHPSPEVHWEDGLLLRPHHLQALQSHCRSLNAYLGASRPFTWGVRRLELRAEAIGNGVLDLAACDLMMPDGTVVVAGQTARVVPLEFQNLGLTDSTLPVWLGIPLANPQGPNVEEHDGQGAATQGRRYLAQRLDLRDENTGANSQSIGLKLLNAQLFLGLRPPAGFQSLQIGLLKKVIEEGEEGRRYRLSGAFVPASLSMESSPALHRVLSDILHQVEEKNEQLHEHLEGRRDLLTADTAERPGTLLKLQATNSVLPVLRQVVAQPELHPFDVYLHLCRLIGELALFAEDWRVPLFRPYEHADPLACFADVKRVVLQLLSAAVETGIQRVPFELADPEKRLFQAAIPERFLSEGVVLALGVKTTRAEGEVAGWFSQGRTVLAGPRAIAGVLKARIEGITCAPDPALHPGLKDRKGFAFLTLARDGELWTEVRSARRLALAGEAARSDDARFYLYAVGVRGGDEEE